MAYGRYNNANTRKYVMRSILNYDARGDLGLGH